MTCCSRVTAPWLLCRIRRSAVTIGDSGFRSSCPSIARNSSLARLADCSSPSSSSRSVSFCSTRRRRSRSIAARSAASSTRNSPAADGRSPARESGDTTRQSTAGGSGPKSAATAARRRAPATEPHKCRARLGRRRSQRVAPEVAGCASRAEIRKAPPPVRARSRRGPARRRRAPGRGPCRPSRRRKRRCHGLAFVESAETEGRRGASNGRERGCNQRRAIAASEVSPTSACNMLARRSPSTRLVVSVQITSVASTAPVSPKTGE